MRLPKPLVAVKNAIKTIQYTRKVNKMFDLAAKPKQRKK